MAGEAKRHSQGHSDWKPFLCMRDTQGWMEGRGVASILSLYIVQPNFDIENPGAEGPDMAIKLLVLANVFFFLQELNEIHYV